MFQRAYNEKDVHRFVTDPPFLPPEHTESVFHQQDQRVRTWMDSWHMCEGKGSKMQYLM